MRQRRLSLALVWPIALLLLVGLLATLQYQWLGQVSDAERAEMQASLRSHADDFAADLDRDILRAYVALQAEAQTLQAGDWARFAAHLDTWRATARYPRLIRDIYFLREGDPRLLRFDADSRTFRPVDWPAALAPLHDRVTATRAESVGPAHVLARVSDPILPDIPAMVVTLPVVQTLAAPAFQRKMSSTRALGQPASSLVALQLGGGTVVATLDRGYMQTTLLPELAARYFPAPVDDKPHALLAHAGGYRLAVVPADDVHHPIYVRGLAPNASISPTQADATVALLTLRTDLADQILTRDQRATFMYTTRGPVDAPPAVGPPKVDASSDAATGRLSIFVQSAGTLAPGSALTKARLASSGASWHLMLQHSAGSLEAAVGQARRRSLTMSFGVLALLAISVGLIAINAQRSQRLAAQQMDFVATVSHELRTPLAVIRSAAQNLSAGVIQDVAQAKRYGDLIDTEGKRLTDMVEQVLEFAGLADNRQPVARRPIDAAALVRDALAACGALLQVEQFHVDVRTGVSVPPVAADESALRRALQNLITNAVKYAGEGRWIGIAIDRAVVRGTTEVQIAVSDHGQGIEAADLPHIFEAFYRGRYATERQIHGNGLGLSLVRRIAEAQGGRVTVRSAAGEGSTFTLHLPAATGEVVVDPIAHPEPDLG
jgi:two-component system sensor histidine kinase SenX3